LPKSDHQKMPNQKSTTKKQKNPAAVALGRLGGLKGGPATAAKLTPEQRSKIASNAAKARAQKLSAADRQRIARNAVLTRWRKKSK
jgi:hypothetical protein